MKCHVDYQFLFLLVVVILKNMDISSLTLQGHGIRHFVLESGYIWDIMT